MENHTVNQKYHRYVQPYNQDVFAVLDSRLQAFSPGWEQKTILDFGCNVGHLLQSAGDRITHEKFYGVDIYKGSLMVAKRKFPRANWIHYNAYNTTFNPDGEKDADFTLPVRPEVIIAYGVFTHCDVDDMRKWMKKFHEIIAPGGVICFSIWEDRDFQNYQQFLRRSFGLVRNLQTPEYERSMYFVNRERLVLDQDAVGVARANWIEAFYKQDFIEAEFPGIQRLEGLHSMHPVYALHVAS